MRRLVITIVTLGVTSMVSAGLALAGGGGSVVAGYGGDAGATNTQVHNATLVAGPAASSGSTLPFTGLDLGVVFVGALGLVILGLFLRRTARKPS
jgi:hypothetical protein